MLPSIPYLDLCLNIGFGRAFSDVDNVDFVDTEKSRVFIHELEPNWWILAVRFSHILNPARS